MKLSNALAGAALFAFLAAPTDADFTATGTFLYRDKMFTYGGGFTGAEPTLPIRLAEVEVRDGTTGDVIASGSTDQTGNFSILVPGTGTRDVEVRSRSRSTVFAKQVRVAIPSGPLYSVTSAVFVGWDQNADLDVGTIISEKIFSGANEANPFNMLDQGVAAFEYALAHGAPDPTANFRIMWPGGPASFSFNFNVTIGDGDAYDDCIILHEIGHVAQHQWSESDSPGGMHFFGDSDQDPRLAYGEGWATYFAAAVRKFQGLFDPGIYMDCDGTGATGAGSINARIRLETAAPYITTTAGEATEVGLACVLWDVIDTASTNDGDGVDDDPLDGSVPFTGGIDGDQMNWDIFEGPVATANNLTIRNHWNAFFAPVDYGDYADFRDVFEAFEIRNYHDISEPNNDMASATPYLGSGAWTPTHTIYYSAASPPAPGGYDSDFWSFDVAAGESLSVATRYPDAAPNADTYADTFLRLFRPDGTMLTVDQDSGVGRNARILVNTDQSGTWTAEVTTTSGFRRTGSYDMRVVRSGSGISSISPPSVEAASLTPQQVTLIGYGLTNTLSLTIDGVPLAAGTDYSIDSDGAITATVPLLTQLGMVDVVVTTSAAVGTAQLQVDEVSSPLLMAPTTVTQAQGIDFLSASKFLDWTWVVVSGIDSPTVIPDLFMLDIGGQGANYVIPWKPIIGTPGYATKHFGPLSGLDGVTVFCQSIILEFANGYDPPWPSSNKQTTAITL